MLEALLDDEEHFKVLINALPDKNFSTKLFDLPTIRKQLDMAIPETFSEEEREQLKLFFYQGGYAVIREWLNRENRQPAQANGGVSQCFYRKADEVKNKTGKPPLRTFRIAFIMPVSEFAPVSHERRAPCLITIRHNKKGVLYQKRCSTLFVNMMKYVIGRCMPVSFLLKRLR